ncbi:MAG: protein kinase [Deltaproteobacteria bacterium]|nr:protein kinase [Deltaproteobacteria bacterium]
MKGCTVCRARYYGNPSRCPLDGGELVELPDPVVGRIIGGLYRVLNKLGEGGMGSVYRARAELRNTDVALKFLAPEYACDPTHKERFLREARAVKKVDHEHIIDIMDFGETEDGLVYLVMELLTGEPLSHLIAHGPAPVYRTFAIVEQICRALIRAHELEVIHRDLKADNIFLEVRDGAPDFVKILDFGLAHMAQELRLTTSGAVFGTPEYMSPEQARGRSVGPSSDLYSLGVITYELLTGRLPFEGIAADLMVMHMREPAPPPSRWVPELPTEAERVVMKLLSKEPGARHRDAHHLLEDVVAVREAAAAEAIPLVGPQKALTRRITLDDMPDPPTAWALRAQIFRRMTEAAYGGRPEPAWVAEAHVELGGLVEEATNLNAEIARIAAQIDGEQNRAKDVRNRLGFALDQLSHDESRVRRDIDDVLARRDRLGSRVTDAAADFERARRAVHLRESADSTVRPESGKTAHQLDLAVAYEVAGRRAATWRVAKQELDEVEGQLAARERERDDLQFQIAQIKGRLGGLNAELEAGLESSRARVAECAGLCDQNAERLGELGARLSAHLAGFPDLRDELFRALASTGTAPEASEDLTRTRDG